MILGAVLAGGKSSRFGSDKAGALLHGATLLDRAIANLRSICEKVVVVGKEGASVQTVADWPQSGMGPLGGVAGALQHARSHGFASVLTCGVDSVALPENLAGILSPPPAYIASQPVIGHWPVDALATLEAILRGDGKHSMLQFAKAVNASEVRPSEKPDNINTPADLAAAEARNDL